MTEQEKRIVEEIRRRHEPLEHGGYLICSRDEEFWPCDSAILLGILSPVRAE
jgi:hypothetical protein